MAQNRRYKTKIQADAGVQIPANAAAGRVLTSDASGNGTWQAPGAVTQIVPRTYKDMTDSAASGIPVRTP